MNYIYTTHPVICILYFSELLERGVSPPALRYLMFIYSNQKCNVRWGNAFSNTFNVQNGVRQGAVSSPVLFCLYIDKVIKLLRCSTIGCQIQGVYMERIKCLFLLKNR